VLHSVTASAQSWMLRQCDR